MSHSVSKHGLQLVKIRADRENCAKRCAQRFIEDELEDIRGVWSVGDQGAFTDELPIGENRGDASGLNVIVSEFRVPPQGLKRSGAINRGSQCRTRDMRSIPRHVGPCYVQ